MNNISDFATIFISTIINYFYFKKLANVTYNIENNIKNRLFVFICFCFIGFYLLPKNFIIKYIIYLFIESLYIIYNDTNFSIILLLKIFVLRIIIDFSIFLSIGSIFDISVSFVFWKMFNFLKLLWFIIIKYIQFIIFLYISRKMGIKYRFNIRYFKIMSFLLSLIFGLCILYNIKTFIYFKHVGRTMVFTLIVYNAALIAFDRYQVKHERIEKEFAEKEKQFALVQQKQKIQDEYNQLLEREQQHVRNIHHDMNNHLMAMLGYIDRQDIDGVRKYVNDLLDESKRASQKVYTGHVSVDAILDAKILKARSLGIDVKESFEVVSFGIMKCVDLTKLLGCALDNAIEAILRIEDDTKKRLKIRMYNNGPYLIVCIGNSIAKGIDVDFNHTSKTYDEKNHGFGVKDIKSIAFEYDGSAYYEFEKDFVMLNVILYVKRDV